MRVLQINSVSGIRSTGRICTDLANMLEQNGDECIVAYGRESVPEKHQRISSRIGSDIDVYAHILRSRLLDDAGFGSKRVTRKFVHWLEDYKPDIIHLHNVHGYYLNIEVLFEYLSKSDIPIVWTLHDCWPFTGHCAYFSFANCTKWRDGCSKCPQLSRYPRSWGYDNSSQNWWNKKRLFTSVNSIVFVSPSKWLAELLNESYLGDYPVEVIPNGVDLRLFRPTPSDFRKQYGIEDKVVVLGVASVWDERKGLKDIIKMAEELDKRYQVVLVGVTKEQKKVIPRDTIAFTHTNNTEELAQIYTAADVFINPTYEDNYPTTNLEAQACGTPVITYQTGGSPETLLPHLGMVLKEKGASELHAAISHARRKENSSISDIDAQFLSKDINYQRYMALYKSLRGGHG